MTDLSVDARLLATERSEAPHINSAVVIFASALMAAGALALAQYYTWRQGALFLLGGALGLVLYHALFGFTSAWRVFIANGRGAGLRAQMVMLAVAVLLFFPVLAQGSLFGQPVHGEYGAVGTSVLVGAFLFGLGMQLGGGCASGTLYTAGGGNTRMLATLAAFIAGSVVGSAHALWWSATPAAKPMSLVTMLGPYGGLAVSLALFAAIAGVSIAIERRVERGDRSAKAVALRDVHEGARAFSTSAREQGERATVDAPKRLRREGGQASGSWRILQG